MKTRTVLLSLAFVLASIVTSACGWNPSVAAVPITAPWDSMNLPVKEDARVWGSTPTELKVAHKADKTSTLAAYEKALTANGWKSAGSPGAGTLLFRKEGKEMEAEFYDFENTGVILTMK
jgi:hypothetical protein